MDQLFWILVSSLSGFIIACTVFLFYFKISQRRRKKDLRKEMNLIINQAKSQAMRIEKNMHAKSRDFERKTRHKLESEIKKEKQQLENAKYQLENQKNKVESEWKRKAAEMEDKIKGLDREKERMITMEQQLEKMTKKTSTKMEDLNNLLERTASMTREQARNEIKNTLEEEMKKQMIPQLIKVEEEMKTESEKRAKQILSKAIARFASEVSTERTISSMPIQGEETKGKIIGREGRNIRALEAACGVDIIIDESQETIIISCFDSLRREVALQSIHRLLEEGRVHPARIEEVVGKIKRDIFLSLAEQAKQVCFELGIHNVKPTLIESLSFLKYRFVSGQNMLKASKEIAYLAGLIASEIGVDDKQAKRAGLLHAIGLSVDHHIEGSYSLVGSEYAKKNGESEAICQAIRCHNEELPAQSTLDHILQSAYSLFHERPGAQQKVIENYINRLKDMESIANSFDGVIRSFAIQAGKEIRVLVDSGKVTDEQAFMLSRDIARKINKEIEASGQLTVSVLRECRMVEQAR